jgi:hypothetical protein
LAVVVNGRLKPSATVYCGSGIVSYNTIYVFLKIGKLLEMHGGHTVVATKLC